MFRWTEASVLCSNLSLVVIYEHVDSTSPSTCLQLMGRGEEPGNPDKYNPDTPRLTVLKYPGARAASPRAALSTALAMVTCTTKSCYEVLVLSPSWGPASATSTSVALYGTQPALDTSIASATTGCQQVTGTDEA
jgi:hypothetical protein